MIPYRHLHCVMVATTNWTPLKVPKSGIKPSDLAMRYLIILPIYVITLIFGNYFPICVANFHITSWCVLIVYIVDQNVNRWL